jgi:hypothetical protein
MCQVEFLFILAELLVGKELVRPPCLGCLSLGVPCRRPQSARLSRHDRCGRAFPRMACTAQPTRMGSPPRHRGHREEAPPCNGVECLSLRFDPRLSAVPFLRGLRASVVKTLSGCFVRKMVDGVHPTAVAPSLCPRCPLWRKPPRRCDLRIQFAFLRGLRALRGEDSFGVFR